MGTENVGTKIESGYLPLVLSVFFGIIGAIIAAFIFFQITLNVGWIFGIATYGTGALVGVFTVLGYKIGGGKFKTDADVNFVKYSAIVMGVIAGILGYFGLYILLVLLGVSDISFSEYIGILEFGIFDVVFIGISALGARWGVGPAVRFLYKGEIEQAEKKHAELTQKMVEELTKKTEESKAKEPEETKPKKKSRKRK